MTNQHQSSGSKPVGPPVCMTVQELRRMASGWVDAHHAGIYRFLARLARNAWAAEDLAQETFLRAFRSCRQLRDPEAVRPWLYRIAWNAYLDYRRSARMAGRSLEIDTELSEFRDGRPDAEGQLLGLELGCLLRRIVDRLPLQQRSVFILRAGHQLSYDEIARCLDCSAAAARSHFRHALRKMKEVCRREGIRL